MLLTGNAGTSDGREFVRTLLVCPMCKGRLDFSPDVVRCSQCSLAFPQQTAAGFDLLPPSFALNNTAPWKDRQREMEGWYRISSKFHRRLKSASIRITSRMRTFFRDWKAEYSIWAAVMESCGSICTQTCSMSLLTRV